MSKCKNRFLARIFRLLSLFAVPFLTLGATTALPQVRALPENPSYSRLNTFGIFTAYSNDSSHILLGDAEKRRLLQIGVSYNRRLLLNRVVNWQYEVELIPVALESDPMGRAVVTETAPDAATTSFGYTSPIFCAPYTVPYSYTGLGGVTYSGTETSFCKGRRWTVGEAMSPAGLQGNFLPRRKLQPFLVGHGGYIYSTHPIPVDDAGSFNFTFDFGAGLEIYRAKTRSVRLQYRYHHISNRDTAKTNPGIDNGLFQVTYAFGR